jgi:hypothetical protein
VIILVDTHSLALNLYIESIETREKFFYVNQSQNIRSKIKFLANTGFNRFADLVELLFYFIISYGRKYSAID